MSFQIPTTTTAAPTSFSFGSPQISAPTAAAPKQTFGNLGGGDGAGGIKPLAFNAPAAPTTTPAVPATLTAAPPSTGLNFGGPVASVAPVAQVAAPSFNIGATAATAAPAITTATTTPSTMLNLAKSTAPTLGAVAPTTTASFSGLGGGTGFANLSTATKTTDSSQVSSATQLSYNQLEEHINKWTLELEEQEKVFTDQATQINAWDKVLIGNNQKIVELNEAVQKVKADQQTLEQELEFISTQHKELEDSILPLQKEFMNIPQADMERSLTYMLVENLDTQLKQMSEDLKEIIDNLNEANKGQDNTDPIIQIGKILNAHMSSLQWIESSSTNICSKLDDLNKMHETFKRESERSFLSNYFN